MCAEPLRARPFAGGDRRARGQALVETLVVAIALVPIAVLVVLLGKYQTIQSAGVAASRAFAFECAARPADCADPARSGWIVEALRVRHFARPDRAILSGERVTALAGASGGASSTGSAPGATGPQGLDRHPLWQDRAGRPLLENLAHVGAAASPQRFDAGLGTALGRAASVDFRGLTGPIGGSGGGADNGGGSLPFDPGVPGAGAAEILDRLAGPARFGLAIEGGLYDARVQVAVAPSHAGNIGFARLDPLAVTMRARTAILSDAWAASGPSGGPASVAIRTDAGSRLDTLRESRLRIGYQLTRWSIDLMGAIGLEPQAGEFRYHQADPDAIPADRLGQP